MKLRHCINLIDKEEATEVFKYCSECGSKMSEIPTDSEPQESEEV